ncbi:hypothetical protein, partial [Klebsiella pneumoniae]|uniref:hypothetical protein n=1 Tax=Klebsiella pneumoniae TaxID=573 RepID=UPI001C5FC039
MKYDIPDEKYDAISEAFDIAVNNNMYELYTAVQYELEVYMEREKAFQLMEEWMVDSCIEAFEEGFDVESDSDCIYVRSSNGVFSGTHSVVRDHDGIYPG